MFNVYLFIILVTTVLLGKLGYERSILSFPKLHEKNKGFKFLYGSYDTKKKQFLKTF